MIPVEPVTQPIVNADGTLGSKPAEYDGDGNLIPDPSWVEYVRTPHIHAVFGTSLNDETDRCARAYGWEIGQGKPLAAMIDSSPDNPFMDRDWRDKVAK
jgi:hypothetical protein